MKFDESTFLALDRDKSSSSSAGEDSDFGGDISSDESDHDLSLSEESSVDAGGAFEESKVSIESSVKLNELDEAPTQLRRSQRNVAVPDRLGYNGVVHSLHSVISVPITTSDTPTVREAMRATYPEVLLWRQAIKDEFETLESKGT